MPVAVRIVPLAKIIFSTFSGVISQHDLHTALMQLRQEPGFDPTFSHIVDFTNIAEAAISTEFVTNLAQQKSLFHCTGTQVIVAPQIYLFGLARMLAILRGEDSGIIQVVESLAEAYAMLGL